VSSNVTLTDAVVSSEPETTGVESCAAEAFAAYGTGAEDPDSAIAVTRRSERPAAFARISARAFASSTAFASACR